jgi:molybdopterin biosynthesis enzyme
MAGIEIAEALLRQILLVLRDIEGMWSLPHFAQSTMDGFDVEVGVSASPSFGE